MLLRYLFWYGLNFEDAIEVNWGLIINETFTSIHLEEWETKILFSVQEVFSSFSLGIIRYMYERQDVFWTDSFSFNLSLKEDSQLLLKIEFLLLMRQQKGFSFVNKRKTFL